MAQINIHNIGKSFGDYQALKGITFDIARGEIGPAFSMPVRELDKVGRAETGHRTGKCYLRFEVADRPGVLAEITAAMDGWLSSPPVSMRAELSAWAEARGIEFD